jgi:hypothetical protein
MRWEYIVISLDKLVAIQENQLIEAGKDGWELVCVSDGRAYLGRQVSDEYTNIRFVEKRDTEEGAEHACSGICTCMTMAGCSC